MLVPAGHSPSAAASAAPPVFGIAVLRASAPFLVASLSFPNNHALKPSNYIIFWINALTALER